VEKLVRMDTAIDQESEIGIHRGSGEVRGIKTGSMGALNTREMMNFKATAAEPANEPTLHCPNCNHEIRLTESLAAPLIEETRRHFQQQLARKDAEVSQKLDAVRREREQLAEAREQIEDKVAERLVAERSQIASAEAKKAREATAAELQAKAAETAELRRTLYANNAKLAEAQQAQAELMRKQRALDEEKRELELTIEKRVQASIEDIRAKAKQEADEGGPASGTGEGSNN
jgi:hypothetical protein